MLDEIGEPRNPTAPAQKINELMLTAFKIARTSRIPT
jgi:hypothetical protein